MKIIELKETVTASNDRDAEVLRGELTSFAAAARLLDSLLKVK